MMQVAPMLESQGRTVIGEQLGIQCLKQRERLKACNEASRPSWDSRRSGVIRAGRQRPQQRNTACAKCFTNQRTPTTSTVNESATGAARGCGCSGVAAGG